MPSPVKLYQREMHERIGFFANWLPGDPIEIGAIGVLTNGQFRQQTSLKDLGIPCLESPAGHRQDLRYTSSSGVRIGTTTIARIAQAATAGLSIEFSEEGAFIFQAIGLRQRRIADRARVARDVLAANDRKEWQRDWVMIEALHIADCATIIVSESRGASVTLDARSEGPLSVEALADAAVGLHVTASVGRMVQVLCANRLRPLYNCAQVTGGLLFGNELKSRSNSVDSTPIEQLLES
jgi:hypothetical protein